MSRNEKDLLDILEQLAVITASIGVTIESIARMMKARRSEKDRNPDED